MTEIYGPPDVVAGMVAFLRGKGVDARTRVPVTRIDGRAMPNPAAGMVRVTRTGGVPENLYQDQPRILIECWAQDQPRSFDLCRRLWALVASIDDQDALPGLVTHHIAPESMPVQYPDPDAPELDRHQFTVEAHVRMEPMEV